MINLKQINETYTIDILAKRGYQLPGDFYQIVDKRKQLTNQIENINHKINLNKHTAEDKQLLKETKQQLDIINKNYLDIVYMIPNIIHDTVPEGKGENDNVVIQTYYNENKKNNLLHHADIGKILGLDLETGVNLAQTRFNVMRGIVAKINRKLANMAVDFYEDLGYELCYVPYLVNEETMFGTGQYPKFKEELFTTHMNKDLFLIPTGEVPLTNIVKNKILKENEVDIKLMTHTPCFRKEVGAYGKDTRGIIRQHQFEKIELVRTCLPENGLKTLEEMLEHVTNFVKKLNIPFRIIELCAGDIGFAGHKAYDIEIWFPHENKYREIATITWCYDFQARRMNAKYKNKNNEKNYIHTLNATGLAVGRVLAAMLENYNEEQLRNFVK